MPTFTGQITSDYYDRSIYRYDAVTGTSNVVQFGNETGEHSISYDTFFQYSVSRSELPPKCNITNAYLRFHANETHSGETCNASIYFQLGYFNLTSGASWDVADFDAVPVTSGVDWDDVAHWTNGNDYDSPDLTVALQEFVDSDYYAELGVITVVVKNNGSSENAVRSADDSYTPGNTPVELHVEYSNVVRVANVSAQVEVSPPRRISDTLALAETVTLSLQVATSDTLALSETVTAFNYTGYQNAIDTPHVGPIRIAKIELSGGTLYLCDRIWGSN